jgi:hypothetical protein
MNRIVDRYYIPYATAEMINVRGRKIFVREHTVNVFWVVTPCSVTIGYQRFREYNGTTAMLALEPQET